MSDANELPIVRRLNDELHIMQRDGLAVTLETAHEAAAIITELVAALEPFAAALKDNYHHQVDDLPIIGGSNQMDLRFKWTLGQFRAASAVLNKVRGGE